MTLCEESRGLSPPEKVRFITMARPFYLDQAALGLPVLALAAATAHGTAGFWRASCPPSREASLGSHPCALLGAILGGLQRSAFELRVLGKLSKSIQIVPAWCAIGCPTTHLSTPATVTVEKLFNARNPLLPACRSVDTRRREGQDVDPDRLVGRNPPGSFTPPVHTVRCGHSRPTHAAYLFE